MPVLKLRPSFLFSTKVRSLFSYPPTPRILTLCILVTSKLYALPKNGFLQPWLHNIAPDTSHVLKTPLSQNSVQLWEFNGTLRGICYAEPLYQLTPKLHTEEQPLLECLAMQYSGRYIWELGSLALFSILFPSL